MASTDRRCDFHPDDVEEPWWDEDIEIPTEYSCNRPARPEGTRCQFHAEVPVDFPACDVTPTDDRIEFAYLSKSDLNGVDLSGAVLPYANCMHLDFTKARGGLTNVRLPGAKLSHATLTGKRLEDVDLTGAICEATQFDHATIIGGSFAEATMESAVFEHTTLRNIDMREASLDHAVCDGARFEDICFDGASFVGASLVQCRFDADSHLHGGEFAGAILTGSIAHEAAIVRFESAAEGTDWDAAASEYLQLRSVARNSSLPSLGRSFFVKAKHCQRRSHSITSPARWRAGATRWLMRYGEGPTHVLGWAFIAIVAFVPLYMVTDGISTTEGVIPGSREHLLEYVYFSVVTFSTLGYGDFTPAGDTARLLAMLQAIVGSILIALFIFTLGRRATY